VIVRESSPEVLTAKLMAGDVDLIVGRFTSPPTEPEVRTPLYDEFIEVCTRGQHPLAHRRTITRTPGVRARSVIVWSDLWVCWCVVAGPGSRCSIIDSGSSPSLGVVGDNRAAAFATGG
jgi:DNA-binding transcriptional LysR family regulator